MMQSQNTIQLEELVNKKYLQRFQDVVSQMANITTFILDSSGNPITQISNSCGFCEFSKKSDKYRKTCDKMNMEILHKAYKKRKTVTDICPHSGLMVAAIPFFLEDNFMGAWIVGQIRFDDINLTSSEIKEQNKDMNQEEIQCIMQTVPLHSRSEFELILNFLFISSKEIVEIASSKANLAKKNEELLTITQKLKYSMDSFQTLFNMANMGIVICDFLTSEIILCNNYHAAYFGMKSEDVIGKRCYDLLGLDSRCRKCPCDSGIFSEKEDKNPPSYTEERYVEIKDAKYYFQTTYRIVRWMDGRLVYIITYIDITERKSAEEKLKFLAFWDQDMQIPNLAKMQKDIINDSSYGYLVVLNIRGLKKINSIYGRDCGDALLRAVCNYINELKIPESTLYSMENADFGILFKKSAGKNIARQIAKNIRNRCEKFWEIVDKMQRHNIYIDVNVGIIPLNSSQRISSNNLYAAIDHTMEVARTNDGLAVYDDKAHEVFQDRQRMELILKNAVHENMRGFSVVYQPIISPNVFLWSGVEALCRWEIPEFGKVPPDKFIPISERNGMISIIGMWVLEQSVIQMKKWGLDKIDNFILEVNLSTIQLNEPDLSKNIEKILKKHQYPPHKLCLEITESNEMLFSKHISEALKRLDELGIVLALDDFGKGYTSFKMLHDLPVKVLKTDKAFIYDIDIDTHLQRLFYAMVELARILGMRIVVEGVEKDSQVKYLLRQGVDFFQGYFFSQPLTVEKMEEKIDSFYNPNDLLISSGFHKLDLSQLDDKQGGHDLDPRLAKILNKCMRELLFYDNESDEAINVALSNIGEGMNVSRAYLYLKEMDGTYSNTNEWCAPDVKLLKDNLKNIPIIQKYPSWISLLEKQGFLVIPDMKNYDEDFGKFLSRQGIKAMVNLPIRKKGQICGFVGFDYCNERHIWALEEVQMLHTLTGIITSILSKMWLKNEIDAQSKMRETIMNYTDALIYVTDLKTDEILFANSKLQNIYKNEKIIGQTCWKVLKNRTERCSYCPKEKLLKNPHEIYRWEFYNEKKERYFKVWDIIIPWINNEPVHFEFAEDITEFKEYQNKVASLAVDSLNP